MAKYDLSPIRYMEPTFLQLAGNRSSYVCPVCGSGSGRKGSGMTSRDGEHWKCWSCGLYAGKLELYKHLNSLSYDDACLGLLKYYGITPVENEGPVNKYPVWLSQDDADILQLNRNVIPVQTPDGEQMRSIYELYDTDPKLYYELIYNRACEMQTAYENMLKDYGDRTATKARVVYEYMGASFDDSTYKKLSKLLEDKISTCKKLAAIYKKRVEKDVQ